MQVAVKRPSALVRVALLTGIAALIVSAWNAWLLYTDAAPFRQPYRSATSQQNAAVLARMGVVLGGLPMSAAFLGLAWLRRPATRKWIAVVGGACLLTSVHAQSIAARLPYGFGSSYEHASPAQHTHLMLAQAVAIAGVVLAFALLGLAWRLPSRRAHS